MRSYHHLHSVYCPHLCFVIVVSTRYAHHRISSREFRTELSTGLDSSRSTAPPPKEYLAEFLLLVLLSYVSPCFLLGLICSNFAFNPQSRLCVLIISTVLYFKLLLFEPGCSAPRPPVYKAQSIILQFVQTEEIESCLSQVHYSEKEDRRLR